MGMLEVCQPECEEGAGHSVQGTVEKRVDCSTDR